jgi:hypothetical protein
MTNSEDDDRAIDWAPRKIRELEGRTNDNSERLLQIEAWMARVTGEEIRSAFERELGSEDIPPGQYMVDAEFSPPIGGTGTDNLLWKAQRRARDEEDKTHLRGTGAPTKNGGIFAVGSTPAGGVVPHGSIQGMLDSAWQRGHDAGVGQAKIAETAEKVGVIWERGYHSGKRAAIDEAESRIQAVIDKMRESGVVKFEDIRSALLAVAPDSIRGSYYEQGLTDGGKKAVENAERRVLAKLREMGWHAESPAMIGVMNAIRGTKPIKDNPQG